ncbi:hypothetical protein GLYMA_03G154901v4 [Glycine max]|nr:hypothetical protein GYH30_007337 [Glycine max]RCW19491.2 hypothetical protein GLYMA_03G154901v4 [Glycine max]
MHSRFSLLINVWFPLVITMNFTKQSKDILTNFLGANAQFASYLMAPKPGLRKFQDSPTH